MTFDKGPHGIEMILTHHVFNVDGLWIPETDIGVFVDKSAHAERQQDADSFVFLSG